MRDTGISALIDFADEVHVNSSLAGFEALMRSRRVTTHGSPFYAGWGLTRDLGDIPARRTRKRTLENWLRRCCSNIRATWTRSPGSRAALKCWSAVLPTAQAAHVTAS